MTTIHVEYRILLPLTLKEYNISQLYIASKLSKTESTGDTSIKVLVNEDYDHEVFGPCRKTVKLLNLNSKIQPFIRKFLPKDAQKLEETSFNAFPRCNTKYKNLYFSEKTFGITVDSMHLQSKELKDNVLEIPEKIYKKTKVKTLNIAAGKGKFDPKSATCQRGPLSDNWIEESEHVMVCYKFVTIEVHCFGFGWVAEHIEKNLEKLFMESHQQLYCEMDEWIGMSMEDIRKMEDETKRELDQIPVAE